MKKNVKKRLNLMLFEIDMDDSNLFWETGYHKQDVNTKEDLNEVIRLLSYWYCGLEKYYID